MPDDEKPQPVSFIKLSPETTERLNKFHKRFQELSEEGDDTTLDRYITFLLDWEATEHPDQYGDLD